jgi:hypothetical protein
MGAMEEGEGYFAAPSIPGHYRNPNKKHLFTNKHLHPTKSPQV